MRFISTLCAIALMTPAPGLSQMPAPDDVRVDAGSRVRIASPVFGPKKQVATVVSVTRDTLVLRQGASTTYRSVATSDITTLEVSKGTHTRKAKGALLGLLIGAGAGAAVGYFTYTKPEPCQNVIECIVVVGIVEPSSKAAFTTLGGALGGIAGALVGAVLGIHPTDAWVPGTVGTR